MVQLRQIPLFNDSDQMRQQLLYYLYGKEKLLDANSY
jgi:hypothetical protein